MKINSVSLCIFSLVSCLLLLVSDTSYAQNVLSKDQVDGLKTQWLDTAKKKKLMLLGNFGQQKLNPKSGKHKSKMQAYKRTGKVPFNLWVEFGVIWEFKSGRNRTELLIGQAVYYYIKDAAGNVVHKNSSNVGRMSRSSYGVFGDLPKPGTYTCVFYCKKDGMLFGKEISAVFTGYE